MTQEIRSIIDRTRAVLRGEMKAHEAFPNIPAPERLEVWRPAIEARKGVATPAFDPMAAWEDPFGDECQESLEYGEVA